MGPAMKIIVRRQHKLRCGVIPPQDYDFLRNAGVQGIYGPGSNVVECAADVLRLLGHNMPPVGE
jgi:methylmalonyl-CoA mutase